MICGGHRLELVALLVAVSAQSVYDIDPAHGWVGEGPEDLGVAAERYLHELVEAR